MLNRERGLGEAPDRGRGDHSHSSYEPVVFQTMRGVPSYALQNVQLQHSLRADPLRYLFSLEFLRETVCFQVGPSLSSLRQSQLVKCVLVVTAQFSSRRRFLLKAQYPVTSHLAFAPNAKKKKMLQQLDILQYQQNPS